jgi:hypothetical protein
MRDISGRVTNYGDDMDSGHFYFLKDEYFIDFPDKNIMRNKEFLGGKECGRPCFYCFQDYKTKLYWMIPISSKYDKYKEIYDKKTEKLGKCDTIVFGTIFGKKKAFLIQNMCPTSAYYIKDEYLDSSARPIRIDGATERKIVEKAKQVLAMERSGLKLVLLDVLAIERKLLSN